MSTIRLIALGFCLTTGFLASAADDYHPGPDSFEQPDAPKGETTKYTFAHSRIFPGTERTYWVYVPRQYDPAKPACLYVNQDGVQYYAPTVFDNLIARHEMPVTIGVFVTPGKVKAGSAEALDRFNRSYEYDGLGDNYVRFLLEELLPEVERKKTQDGRAIHLSTDPNDRAIGGSSSGAICAFTAAWERPDAFRRVFSSIGTYVDQRGGNDYPSMIRKFEPKPLRIYLQDGTGDLNKVGGNWHLANEEMLSALEFSGYQVNHIWGDGGHNGKQATAIFPDAMRWLWADWPREIQPGVGSHQPVAEWIVPGAGWTEIEQGVFPNRAGKHKVLIAQPACFAFNGTGYVSDPVKKQLTLVTANGAKKAVDQGMSFGGDLCLSADQSLLFTSDPHEQFVYSFHINPDGTLADRQAYFHLRLKDGTAESGARGLAVDSHGNLYVASKVGIQVFDQAGRVNGVLATPLGVPVSNIVFGGPELGELYMNGGGRTFSRKLRVKGVSSVQPPIKPTPPNL